METLLWVRCLLDSEVNKIRRFLLGEVKSNSYQASEIKCKWEVRPECYSVDEFRHIVFELGFLWGFSIVDD